MRYNAGIVLAMGAAVLATPMPKQGNNAALAAAIAAAGGNNNNNNNNNANAKANVDAATQQQVATTIQNWLNDIAAVNNFVDTAGQLKNEQDISDAAAQAFVAAQDEGTSNDALGKAVQLDASGLAAAAALQDQFNIIGPAINDTITNPQNLQKNLDAINGARCPPPAGTGAIFEEGAVQQSAATAAGLNAPSPALPNACQDLAQKQLDANAADAKAGDANAADAKAGDANAADANAADAADAKAADAKAADAKAGDAKAGDAKAADAKAGDAKAEDAKAEDANAEDANAEDANAEDANAEDANAEDAKAEDAKAAGADAAAAKSASKGKQN